MVKNPAAQKHVVFLTKGRPTLKCLEVHLLNASGVDARKGLAPTPPQHRGIHPWLKKQGASAPQAQKIEKNGCGKWIFDRRVVQGRAQKRGGWTTPATQYLNLTHPKLLIADSPRFGLFLGFHRCLCNIMSGVEIFTSPERELNVPESFVTVIQENAHFLSTVPISMLKKEFGSCVLDFFVDLSKHGEAAKIFADKCLRLVKYVKYSSIDFEVRYPTSHNILMYTMERHLCSNILSFGWRPCPPREQREKLPRPFPSFCCLGSH